MSLLQQAAEDQEYFEPGTITEVPPGKKLVQTVRVVDGHEVPVEILVDDVEGLAWEPRGENEVLNKDIRRVDAPQKVTGRAVYAHDVRLPGMLYGRLVTCPHPRAEIGEVDFEAARAVGGTVACVQLREGSASYLGQPVAAVAAETPELAEDALRAVRVRWEPLPYALSTEQALAEDAPQLDRRGNTPHLRERGDEAAARAALEGCDFVHEARYSLPIQHHVCLETHGVVVDYRGGDEATVWASTQATFSIPPEAREPLGLPQNRVVARVEHMGGGFGSKFGLGVEGVAACKLAVEAGRPVHLLLRRRDEFLAGGNRSGSLQHHTAGVTSDGKLVAFVADAQRLGGVGRGSLPDLPYIYPFEHAYSRATSVLTNLDANRAMRAPGHPQASFAMESTIDELAYGIGMDPLELRIRNLPDPAWERQLRRCAEEIGWADHPHRTAPGRAGPDGLAEGIGFGVAVWGGGGHPECQVDVRIDPDGSVGVACGSQDLGTGTRTLMAAVVAEELGLAVEQVTARLGDSRLGRANGSGGSTTAACLAPAVLDAARKARLALAERLAPTLGCAPELVVLEDGHVRAATGGERLPFERACRALGRGAVEARGEWRPELAGSGVHGAQAARVRVDVRTGRVDVLHIVHVQDVGLPLNRLALRSQLQGGMLQGLSQALLERRVVDAENARVLTADLGDYKIVGCKEVPRLTALIDDGDTRQEVIGVGEPPVVPGPGAIANAVRNACGARVTDLPLTPDQVLAALGRVR